MAGVIGLALAAGLTLQAGIPVESDRLVRVFATARDDRGTAVDDLEPADFTVTEDGVERRIEDVRFVTPAGGGGVPASRPTAIRSRADEQVEAAREGARLFAFFLDEYHVAPGPDADDVRVALARFVREQLGPLDLLVVFKPLDSLADIRLTRDREAAVRSLLGFSGRKGVYDPRNDFERDFLAADPRTNDRGRAQISMTGLRTLVTHLGGLEAGQKALVVVSEGIAGDEWGARLDATARVAERGGVAIYTIDPRREEDITGEDVARKRFAALADATEGRTTYGAGRAEAGLRQMADDLNGHYVLTFRSPGVVDGGERPVRVATARPGVSIRSSRGHWADSLADPYGGPASHAETSPPPARPMRRTSTLIQPWFGVTHAGDGGSQVSFVWEPARSAPGASRASRVPARVALRVSAEDGAAIFDGVVMPAGPGSGTGSKAVFHAPAGRLRVEMRIEDDRAEYLDFDVRDVDVGVPDQPVVIGTAQVFRTRNAREYRAVASDANAVPAASREFSRAERLVIRVPVFAGEAGVPVVTATLASAFGQVMRALTAAPGPSAGVYQIDLPLAGLVAGDYRLEITAAGLLGAAREVVSLRVLP